MTQDSFIPDRDGHAIVSSHVTIGDLLADIEDSARIIVLGKIQGLGRTATRVPDPAKWEDTLDEVIADMETRIADAVKQPTARAIPPRIVIVIADNSPVVLEGDEIAQFAELDNDARQNFLGRQGLVASHVRDRVGRIARLGRHVHVHVLIVTDDVDVDVETLPADVLAAFTTRIAAHGPQSSRA